MEQARLYQTEQGTLEYVWTENGEPVLMLHGGHSNCGETFGRTFLAEQGYSVILPSRPGYGGSDAALGKSLSAACEAYRNLLDELKIDKVHIVAVSAGGPSGLRFAVDYPERVRSLTLISAVTGNWLTPQDGTYRTARLLFDPAREKYVWKLLGGISRRSPALMLRFMSSSFTALAYREVKKLMRPEDLVEFGQMIGRQRSGRGFMLDLSQCSQIEDFELTHIRCPALILHSRHDAAVPFSHAERAERRIERSELCASDAWGHLIWLGEGKENVYGKWREFMQAVTERA